MDQNAPDGRPNIFPSFHYRDATAAIDWLCSAFGFEKLLVVPGPDGTIRHAELRLGPGVVMLGSMHDDIGEAPTPRTAAALVSTYIAVDDPDAHYARAKAAGAEIVQELHDADYGSRGYTARDLEGYLWSFGTYRPDA